MVSGVRWIKSEMNGYLKSNLYYSLARPLFQARLGNVALLLQKVKMKCERCGKDRPLTRHHHILKKEAMKIVEERMDRPREDIKHFISRKNKVRKNGKIELLCVSCHNQIHGTPNVSLITIKQNSEESE